MAALTAYNNDTGAGTSNGLNVLSNVIFLPHSNILTDGSNFASVNSIDIVHAASIEAITAPDQLITTNLTGPSGSVYLVFPAQAGLTTSQIRPFSPTRSAGSLLLPNPL